MFRWTSFPLAALLPSADSSGVTREFVDLFGTMGASDFSEACRRGVRPEPFRGCLSLLRRGTSEISRFPCRRHMHTCRSLRPRGTFDGRAHPISYRSVASRHGEGVGVPIAQIFEAQCPGAHAPPPTLRPSGRPNARKEYVPECGELVSGQDFVTFNLGHFMYITCFLLPVSRRSPNSQVLGSQCLDSGAVR